MSIDLTQGELNEIFYGESPTVEAKFYDKELVNSVQSTELGRKVMMTRTYIHLKCVREKSESNRPAQDMDRNQFPAAWKTYQEKKADDARKVSDLHSERPTVGEAYAKAQTG